MIRNDDRGVTAPIEYVYTFAVAAILITGLVIAATNVAGDQRRRTVVAQMDVVGNQVAGSLESIDRTVQTTQDGTLGDIETKVELPNDLLGGGYTVEITDPDPTAPGTVTVEVRSSLTDRVVRTKAELSHLSLDSTPITINGGTVTVGTTPTVDLRVDDG